MASPGSFPSRPFSPSGNKQCLLGAESLGQASFMNLFLPFPSLPPPRLRISLCLWEAEPRSLSETLTGFPLAAPACGPTWSVHVAWVGGGSNVGPTAENTTCGLAWWVLPNLLRRVDAPSLPFLSHHGGLISAGRAGNLGPRPACCSRLRALGQAGCLKTECPKVHEL